MSKIRCKYVFKRGQNKGQNCQRYMKNQSTGFCKKHDTGKKTDTLISYNTTPDKNNNIFGQTIEPISETVLDVVETFRLDSLAGQEERENNNQEKYETYKFLCQKQDVEIDPMINPNNPELDTVINEMTAEGLNKIHDGEMKYSEEFMVNALFNINVMVFNSAEVLSKLQDKYTNLEGLTKDVFDEEDEYKKVLYEIYTEYYEEIDQYLTPLTVYAMLVVKTTSLRYVKNKKKKSSEEE
jgi:hypothetical protein